MKLLSIQVSLPKTISFRGHSVTTGIFKDPVAGPVMLRTLNLDGDGQADLSVHGGRDKAVYAYPCDAYPEWSRLRPGDSFPNGAMGENLSFDRLDEGAIFIGDRFALGEAIVQVTQPRFPCQKLAIKFADPAILRQFMTLGRPGVYFRVLQEGLVSVGDELKLLGQERGEPSVKEVFDAR